MGVSLFFFVLRKKTGWFNIQSWHWHGFDWTDIIKLSIIECLRFSICQASCPAYGFKDPRGWTFPVKGQSLDPASLIFFVTFEVQGTSIFTILTIHQFCYNRLILFLMMFIAYRPNWQSWLGKQNAFASAHKNPPIQQPCSVIPWFIPSYGDWKPTRWSAWLRTVLQALEIGTYHQVTIITRVESHFPSLFPKAGKAGKPKRSWNDGIHQLYKWRNEVVIRSLLGMISSSHQLGPSGYD